MFNQRKNSIRNKSDTVSTPNSSTSTNTTTSTSKGLLSFNTSNLTKLFKNSTNFVQSTFGSVAPQMQSQATPTQNAYASITEQSFTIPSIKKRQDTLSHGAPKKERDILSVPVLIQPVSMSNASPLANSSSYKKIIGESLQKNSVNGLLQQNPTNIEANANDKVVRTIAKQKSLSSINVEKINQKMPATKTATIATRENNVKTNNMHEKSIPDGTIKSAIHPAFVDDSNTNILFETVKVNKQMNAVTSSPSQSTFKVQSAPAMLPSFAQNEINKNDSTISNRNHINNANEKYVYDGNVNNSEENIYDRNQSIENGAMCIKQQSKNMEKTIATNENTNDNKIKIPFITLQSTKLSSPYFPITQNTETFNDCRFSTANTNSQHKFYNQINDNRTIKTHTKNNNNNANEIEGTVNCNIDTSTYATISNNNFDNNYSNDCAAVENSSIENSYRTACKEFESVSTTDSMNIANRNVDNSKTVENIYVNCVKMPIKASNLDNYQEQQQQDTNENVIQQTSDGQNNNYKDDINFYSQITSNNNALIIHDQPNISDASLTSSTTSFSCSSNNSLNSDIDSSSCSNSNSDKPTPIFTLTNNPNQSLFASNTSELYDILEETDDDEHSTLLQYKRWSSTCSLYEPKNNNMTEPSLSSFSAAIAFARELQNPTNRNPFLQLIASTPMNEPCERTSETFTITTTSTESPIVATAATATSSSNNSSSDIFYEKNFIGIAAPLISSTFNNNNDQNDICSAFMSSNKCSQQSTFNISNCASTLDDFPMQLHHKMSSESEQQSQVDNFVELNDLQLNGISNSTTKYHISSDVMDTMFLFLKEHGNEYIKQFMQVIQSNHFYMLATIVY